MSDNPYQSPSAPTSATYRSAYPLHAALASRWTRFCGAILDGLIMMVAGIPGFAVLAAAGDDEIMVVGWVLAVGGMLVVGIINWVMITQRGQSIAKRMLGMRIILRDTGALPGFLRGVILRTWVPFAINQFCNLFSLLDALWIFSDERQCIHDLIAGTVVLDVRYEHLLHDGKRSKY